jgi:adenine phosphoribosyltransferase
VNTLVDLKQYIRAVPDFPKPGILFRDITPLLLSPYAFKETIEQMAVQWEGKSDMIAALDARGFVFGSALALKLGLPLVLVRKKGKLPGKTIGVSYGLEYGKDSIEICADTLPESGRVLVVDDLLATGGTAKAACDLLLRAGLTVSGCAFVIELTDLPGRNVLLGHEVKSVLAY